MPNKMSTKQFNKKLCQFIQFIQKNDMKSLRIAMKTQLRKNLALVQSGILIAFQNGNCEALKILMSSPLPDLFEDKVNLLHCVVLTSKVEFLKILISDKRVDVNKVVGDTDGRTPLMVACTGGKIDMVKELLKHPKVDVNAQDEIREWFALCYALHMGTPAMVQLLLNHKDISQRSIQESLLLGLAAVSFEHFPVDLELLDMLLKKNFENEFSLKNLTNNRFEHHEHLQNLIAEEVEMKIREEYFKGAKIVYDNTKIISENTKNSEDGNDESTIVKTEAVLDFNTLCWKCSLTRVKLYKCGGCRKARYCGKQCITNDWEEHMSYCLKVQEKRNKKQKC